MLFPPHQLNGGYDFLKLGMLGGFLAFFPSEFPEFQFLIERHDMTALDADAVISRLGFSYDVDAGGGILIMAAAQTVPSFDLSGQT